MGSFRGVTGAGGDDDTNESVLCILHSASFGGTVTADAAVVVACCCCCCNNKDVPTGTVDAVDVVGGGRREISVSFVMEVPASSDPESGSKS